jgi:ElaB/YqjD/DUF883 family membrane-anchored ribosome-binding protein
MNAQNHEKIKALKEEPAESLDELKAKVVDIAHDAAKLVDNEARKNPWHFVGFAALLAAIFGFLLGKKTKR